jgi:hypothetical protein
MLLFPDGVIGSMLPKNGSGIKGSKVSVDTSASAIVASGLLAADAKYDQLKE